MTSCPKCGTKRIDPLTSMNKMWCYECEEFFPFPLKGGKKSVLIDGYVGERDKVSCGYDKIKNCKGKDTDYGGDTFCG